MRGPAEADEPSGPVEVFPVGALTCELDCGSSKHVCWNYASVISQLVHCLRSRSSSTKRESAPRRSGRAVLIRPPLSHVATGWRVSFLWGRNGVKRGTVAVKPGDPWVQELEWSPPRQHQPHQNHLNEASVSLLSLYCCSIYSKDWQYLLQDISDSL